MKNSSCKTIPRLRPPPSGVLRPTVESKPMHHTSATQPFVLEVPILEDAAVDALHTFLLDLLTQFENHYFAQLHRHQQDLAQWHREMLDQQQALARPTLNPDARGDLDFDDQIPFCDRLQNTAAVPTPNSMLKTPLKIGS